MAPPSRLWNPTSTGGLLESAFCGAAVVVGPPAPAVVVAPPAVVVAPAGVVTVDATVVALPLLLLLSLPHAATAINAPAAMTAETHRAVRMLSPFEAAPLRFPAILAARSAP
jgi:hypothetical protein